MRREERSAPREASPTEAPEPGARSFVWGAWGLLTLAAMAFVARYGSEVPVWDDYVIVPVLAGDRPVTLDWLWAQANEHRIALPKLILLCADRLAGNDIRAGMFLSVATLAALAASLIALAARLPGGTHPSDAFLPLLLLHLGHATNLLWSYQLSVILPTALGVAFLVPIVGRMSWPGPATAVPAGLGLGLLPLCGGNGLMFVPALALWLLAASWAQARSGRPGGGRRGALIALAVVPGLTLTSLYFVGFRKGLHPEAPGGAFDGLRAGLQFLSVGVGMPAAMAWPWSGAATLGLVASALGFLGRAWLRLPRERPRIFGLVAFLLAVLALAGAVGWGRGWAGDRAGFQDRYITMATPLWCWMAFAFRLYAPTALSRLIPNVLFAALCVLAWPNVRDGIEHGRDISGRAEALAQDLRSGVPAYRIVRRHTPFLHPSQDEAARFLPILRRAGIGPFGSLRADPPFRETRWPLEPTSVSLARWEGTTAHVTGVDPQITFKLPGPRPVAGIRIKYSHANSQGAPGRFQLAWKRPDQPGYSDERRYANWNLPTGEGKETTIWIDDTLDQFRIQPDNQPCEFRIDEIVILESS